MTKIDRRFGGCGDIDADNAGAEHRAQVMRDESVTATNIQNFSTTRNQARNFQRHVVGAADFAAALLARPAPLHRD